MFKVWVERFLLIVHYTAQLIHRDRLIERQVIANPRSHDQGGGARRISRR